jgi:hypothetical protein
MHCHGGDENKNQQIERNKSFEFIQQAWNQALFQHPMRME